MNIKKILNPNTQKFRNFWEIYVNSFDPNERRSQDSQIKLLNNKLYKLFIALEENQSVGFLAAWEFDKVVYIEHFAITEKLRNKGIGTALLMDYLAQKNKLIILEVDRPENEIAKRRIVFYERLGFRLNIYDYIQPPYEQDKQVVPMFLMTFPREINNDEFLEIRSLFYRLVYGRGV